MRRSWSTATRRGKAAGQDDRTGRRPLGRSRIRATEALGMKEADHDVAVIGGGQAGLAVAYYLRRAGLDFLVLDAEDRPGGAWLHAWDFASPVLARRPTARFPAGRCRRASSDGFPSRDEVIDYLTRYEQRYAFPIERSCHVEAVERDPERLCLRLRDGRDLNRPRRRQRNGHLERTLHSRIIRAANCSAAVQLHSAEYRSPIPLLASGCWLLAAAIPGRKILAELSALAETVWVTLKTLFPARRRRRPRPVRTR